MIEIGYNLASTLKAAMGCGIVVYAIYTVSNLLNGYLPLNNNNRKVITNKVTAVKPKEVTQP
jgi:hypothetical protein